MKKVDELLRHGVFVDLYAVVRQSVLIGEPAYSLKNVEKLYQEKRQGEVTTAGESMVFFQQWLVDQDGADWTTSATLRKIRDYNQEDCESTWTLAKWLRLFVDEAGQVSVANLVGMAPSTANIVLIGDQIGLSQPVQGSHSGESGLSTLDHLLQDKCRLRRRRWWGNL